MGTLRPRVYTARDAAIDSETKEDGYLAKVVKYIPGEITAAYVAATGALETAKATVPLETMLWVVAAVLFVLTPIWILVATAEPNKPRPVFHAVAAPIAFACWVFALGGPFAFQRWYVPVYGTLVLILATFVVPIAERAFVKSP
ncbi:MAG: hypothetical protein ACFFCW_24050 [Candidatus Hodarchaeota archaeon]